MQIYIHIPFCKKKCLYCDFNSYANCSGELIFGYLTSLNKEIELASKHFGKDGSNEKITSVFIGGGTPSLLDAKHVEKLLENVKNHFDLTEDAEITIEANPESLTEEKLVLYKRAGVNRLSVGVQSLSDENLKAIGRIHDKKTALDALNTAKKYFENISCDLMIGFPFDSVELVKEEVEELAKIVCHLSCYTLILEEETPLEKLVREGKVKLPSDDETIDLLNVAVETLKEYGFERYEVSNFAKGEHFSKHNFGYWTREEYLGFGAGAYSYLKARENSALLDCETRFSSVSGVEEYAKTVESADDYFDIARENVEKLDDDAIFDEKIMLGLRTSYGVDENLIAKSALEKYARYFVKKDGRVALSDDGFAVMNTILVDLMRLKDAD
ncbi:MAG: radical SAM family heme chaperone HemW [Clostridia bacterium]|nr:radical SAM family heme chaperone HemW [Clostridia bacterium]